jgi:hypothetical protein
MDREQKMSMARMFMWLPALLLLLSIFKSFYPVGPWWSGFFGLVTGVIAGQLGYWIKWPYRLT